MPTSMKMTLWVNLEAGCHTRAPPPASHVSTSHIRTKAIVEFKAVISRELVVGSEQGPKSFACLNSRIPTTYEVGTRVFPIVWFRKPRHKIFNQYSTVCLRMQEVLLETSLTLFFSSILLTLHFETEILDPPPCYHWLSPPPSLSDSVP